MALELSLDPVRRSHEQDANAEVLRGVHRAGDDRRRRVVAAQGVDGDNHQVSSPW